MSNYFYSDHWSLFLPKLLWWDMSTKIVGRIMTGMAIDYIYFDLFLKKHKSKQFSYQLHIVRKILCFDIWGTFSQSIVKSLRCLKSGQVNFRLMATDSKEKTIFKIKICFYSCISEALWLFNGSFLN